MTIYTMKATHSDHVGGTKFYQVIQITSGGKGVVVTHWGSKKTPMPGRPKSGGQTKIIFPASSYGAADEFVKAKAGKTKRGYEAWTVTENSNHNLSDAGFASLVHQWFERKDADRILAHFGAGDDVEEPPSLVGTMKSAAGTPTSPPTPKHEEWGSW